MSDAVLMIDDEEQFLFSSTVMLRSEGIDEIHAISDSRRVMGFLEGHEVGVIVLDLYMPHISGTELLPKIVSGYPQIPVIVITAANQIETAVECMKAGAFDYIVKPTESSRFVSSVKRALELRSLRNQVNRLKEHLIEGALEHEEVFAPIITVSEKMRGIFRYVEAVAASEQPILIIGETGVGKELVARAAHEVSGVKGEFVAVNVAGLDDAVFSDTLFGHRKGAFTGAADTRDGLILKAAGGTLFLDEIGDLTEGSQVKLLRLLQERSYYPLGSDAIKQTDARLVIATNRDLQSLVSSGRFRNDLYYRLRAHQIQVPPLRDRTEDIPHLLGHFFKKAAGSMNRNAPTYPPELVTLLSVYGFPGNVRELESMVYDAVALHKSGVLSMESFREAVGQAGAHHREHGSDRPQYDLQFSKAFDHFPTFKEAEEYLINEAMELSEGNQGVAASLLGITRQALNKRLQRKKKS